MPRIRTIKPELWQDEKLAALDPLTRLVFVGLISMADDAGRLVDNVKSIDGFIFPETDDSAKEALGILARLSRILRYVAPNGQRCIQIVRWGDHQRVDHPNKYVLPAPDAEAVAAARDTPVAVDTRENLATVSRNVRATTSTSTPTPISTPTENSAQNEPASRPEEDAEPATTAGQVMAAVRKYLWHPDGLPPPDYSDGREMSVIRALMERESGADLIRAVHGLLLLQREGEVDWIGSGKITLRAVYNSKNGSRDMLTQALDAYARGSPDRKSANRKPGQRSQDATRANFILAAERAKRGNVA